MNASASTSTTCYHSQPKCSSSCSARTTLHPGTGKCLHATSRNSSKNVKLNIALYVIGPGDDPKETPTASELLTVSVRMARAGADGLLYLTDKAAQMQEFQKAAIAEKDTRERLKSYGGKAGQEVLDLVTSWEKLF